MKALVYEEYAPDDNYERILKLKEISDPRPKSNEVVFKVKATGLNYDDIWGMRGKPIQIPMPHISGTDAAGEVIAIGEDVTTIKVGDRIVSHGNISCRVCNACTDGREYDCRERKVWGFQTGPLWGGYCEITHLPEVNVAKIPDNISYEEAAAASMVLTTSWHMLVDRAKIKPGQTILIMGGGSGMGTFGIQIAKLFDCDVITTASPDKLDRCLKIGADYAVDHRKEDWHKEVFTITKELGKKKNQSPGVDIIFEHIGGSHWNKELTLLKYGATLVTTGATTGYDVKSDLRHIFFKGTNILGSTQGTKTELEESIYWMSKGKIKSIIDSVYTFENAVEAHKKMLKGNIFGKILMKPD
jgi:NADPH:quinone reductase-like Zn-dependent oxidoreductase